LCLILIHVSFFLFFRSLEWLQKARDELAHHHSQLVQVSHKYERSVFKNAKLEDSFSATKRELEEFKRKDIENAKAIKQVICFFDVLSCHEHVGVVPTFEVGSIHGT
jgi:hypothetical protein